MTAEAGSALADDRTLQQRHLIYLHGRIVQDQQSMCPRHEEYGIYQMAEIIAALRERGFVVDAEIRPRGTSVSDGADRAVAQVRRLLDSGVPADRITVLGASMGAAIALRAAVRLRNSQVRFALLGPCLSANVVGVAEEEGAVPAGPLLVVRDESDIPSTDCAAWATHARRHGSLRAREVIINTGFGHGFLYRPLAEWLDPVTAWATASTNDPGT